MAVFALGLSFAAAAPASEFDWLVRQFSRQSGTHETHIPFFGLVRFGVAVAHPAGTSALRLAIFERVDLESEKFNRLTDIVTGDAWKSIVRVRSRNGESTNIYAQESRKDLRLLITSLDGHEIVFVELRIKPEQLIKFIDDHRGPQHKPM